jgi:hypothetical protein
MSVQVPQWQDITKAPPKQRKAFALELRFVGGGRPYRVTEGDEGLAYIARNACSTMFTEDGLKGGRVIAMVSSLSDADKLKLKEGVSYLYVDGIAASQGLLRAHYIDGKGRLSDPFFIVFHANGGLALPECTGEEACFPDGGYAATDTVGARSASSGPWVACAAAGCCCGATKCHEAR